MTDRTNIAIAALAGLVLGCASDESGAEGAPERVPSHDLWETRVFDAPLERVWRAWAVPEEVREWWGPHGFSVPVADMDFREGGSSFVCMQAPDEYGGGLYCNTWTYRTIEPHHRIDFVLHFTDENRNRVDPATIPGMPPGIPPAVPHEITFRALGSGRTEMTIVEYGYTTEEAREQSKAGLEQVLEKLEARVTGGSS
jgi:uncharacterized protein YndB with AHSA1/START domain